MISLFSVLAVAVGIFGLAYVLYGRYLGRVFDINDERPTPAHQRQDGQEFVPTRKAVLFGHHFSSIAGGAVIVGPITAALAWGWVPAVLWIVIGTVVFGGLNDFASLTASIRHGGQSVGHIFEQYIDARGKKYLLAIAAVANLLVIGSLSLVTAIIFDAYPSAATASVIYVGLAVLFGLYWHYFGLPFLPGTILFVIGMCGGVLIGFEYPLVLVPHGVNTVLPTVVNPNVSAWLALILLYAFVASVLPVWSLLQPRDYLSSFLLYAGLFGALVAVVVGTLFGTANAPLTMRLDPFSGIMSEAFGEIGPLVPMLFPTIFCGAACGFHSMVCCGTTSKQLDRETDAYAIGYGSTIAEGVLAVLAVGMVAIVPKIPSGTGLELALPTFATGGGIILSAIGIPREMGSAFMALMLSAFSLTTVDTSVRLGRYLFDEAFAGRETMTSRIVGTETVSAGWQVLVAYLLIASGSWATLWPLFGGSVQVFAGLTMFTLGVWLARRHGTGQRGMFLGAAFLLTMSTAALLYVAGTNLRSKLLDPDWIAAASTLEVLSIGVRVVVIALLVGLTVRILWMVYHHFYESDDRGTDTTGADD